jgi:hypothetical protein
MSIRKASVDRKTNETNIQVSVQLDHEADEAQKIEVKTGIGFLDHVRPALTLSHALTQPARCSMPSQSTAVRFQTIQLDVLKPDARHVVVHCVRRRPLDR